jgi:beta-lactamase class A
MKSPKARAYVPVTIAFICGAALMALAFWALGRSQSEAPRGLRQSDIASSSYQFTDPLMGVAAGMENASPSYAGLYRQLSSYISSQQQRSLQIASVNFRDIYQSEGFVINPTELYDPASLTKVPLAMAYYSLAQTDPEVLSAPVLYSGAEDLDANEQVKSPVQLVAGQSYTVEQLIEHMVRYSDNNAEQLLANHLAAIGQLSTLSTLFADLGIKPSKTDPDDTSVQSYSLFLRVLYNATYLDRDYSERLLKLLSEGDFAAGISAGAPAGTVVAQKFGDARIPDSQGNIVGAELQNCGIVYYPNHPYLLCIMTKGKGVSTLEGIIAQLSRLTYEAVAQKYGS